VRNPHILYADVLVTELSPESVSQITEVFNRMGISDWLEQNPFSSLEFSRVIMDEGEEVSGWYEFATLKVAVALSKNQSEYEQELIWGQMSKVSTAAATPEEAVQRTLVHELGHHIHRKLGDIDPMQFNIIFRGVGSNAVSNYAKTRGSEYFAESFSAYTFHRTELFFHDQLGYDMMERVLKALGIEVAEL
jgi:hypothetical protein